MIKNLYIENLFGRFNYNIALKTNGITIITGPNGFGKSTILKIINALSKERIQYLIGLDFSKIEITFDTTKTIIEKNDTDISIDGISLSFFKKTQDDYIIHSRRRGYFRKTPDGYIDMRTGRRYTDDEFDYDFLQDDDFWEEIMSYGNDERYPKELIQLKQKLKEISENCGRIRLISEQRLIRRETQPRRADEIRTIDVISDLPEQLKKEIQKVYDEYSSVSNKLDSSYPKRLFSAKDGLENKNEFTARLNATNEKFKKLNQYGLVDISIIDSKNYNSKHSTALKIYFDDFAEKFKVFQELIQKLDLFTSIINERLTFKKILITRTDGFKIVDEENEEKTLELSQLSSGEKQEIVLFYELIFNTKSEFLLLIDEPEISLHIMWQKKFMDDLLAVSKQTKISAVVATHSPQIVSKHWDIQIDLGEMYGVQLDSM